MIPLPFRQLFSLLFLAFIGLLAATALQAWTGPTATAPAGNVAAPINVGTTDQVKDAGISVNSLAVFGSQYIQDKLGIGRISPVVALDVNGSLRLADGGEVCQAVTAGVLIFNHNTQKLEYCDGVDWYTVNGTVTIVSSGSQTMTSGGSFTVPAYASLTVTVNGGGGGGGGYGWVYNGQSGGAGGVSSISSLNLLANGGTGGQGSYASGGGYQPGANGVPGTASGCDTNTTGGGGNGGAGGASSADYYSNSGGSGGSGGRCSITYTYGLPGAPTRDTVLSVVVGAGGAGGAGGYPGMGINGTTYAPSGSGGSVTFTWQ